MTKHAVLSASSSGRWLECPGSIALSHGLPDSSGEAARWGTAAHELASWCLEEDKDAEAYRGRFIEVEGTSYTVDDKMIGIVQVYLGHVRTLLAEHGGQLLVEQQVDYSAVVGVPESFGTADAIILGDDGVLVVVDLKTGQREVDARDNTQLRMYALGALEEFSLVQDFDSVRLVISQPPKSHTFSDELIRVSDLAPLAKLAAKQGQIAVALLEEVNDVKFDVKIRKHLNAGEHCDKFYCRAKAKCPKLRAVVAEAVFDDFEALDADSDNVAPRTVQTEAEHLAWLYSKLDLIESWCKGVREQAFELANTGEKLPGLKMVRGRAGNRAWADEAEAEAVLKSMRLKLGEMYKQSLQSPTQIEKLLKDSPRRLNKVLPLITRSEGKLVLVPESDKRAAVDVAPVADSFDVVTDETTDDLV